MARPGSRVCVLALLAVVGAALGCNKPERDAATVDSPSPSAAGTEATTETKTSSPAGGAPASTARERGLARSLVAVASTGPSEAEPCERTCGRIGDCLLDSDDYGSIEAGGLELQCLDLCVHAPASAPARAAFLTCEQRQACGELLACAEAKWDALDEVREGPKVQGIVATSNPCKVGCEWLYSCIYTSAPPGESYVSPEHEEAVRYCVATNCEGSSAADRDSFADIGVCLRDGCGRINRCL